MFQDDIYPPTFAGKAAHSAEEWISGQNKDPLLIAFSGDGLKELSAADSQVVSSCCIISDHLPRSKSINVHKSKAPPPPQKNKTKIFKFSVSLLLCSFSLPHPSLSLSLSFLSAQSSPLTFTKSAGGSSKKGNAGDRPTPTTLAEVSCKYHLSHKIPQESYCSRHIP